MADNVVVTAGVGTTVHADEYAHGTLGSGKTQLVKLVDGTLDSDTPIVVDVGAKANALRVAPANDITDATYIGDIKFGESIPAGTNNIGDVDVLTIAAGDNNIGNVDIVSGTITTVSTVTNLTSMGGQTIAMAEGALSVGCQRVTLATDDDAVAHLSTIATNTVRTPITNYGQAKVDNADTTTARVLVATAGAVKFYITSIILSAAAAGSYWIEDTDAAQITCKFTLAANGGVALSFPQNTPFKSTTANKGLNVKGSAAGVVGCQITYYTAA